MAKIQQNSGKICDILEKNSKISAKNSAIFNENFEIRDRCKGVHCVDLGESFPTSIYLQNLASIQPRTSLVKFGRSPRTDPPGRSTRPAAWSSDVHNPGYDAGGDESADADDPRNESSIGAAGNGACADQRRIEVHLTVLTLAAPSESDASGPSVTW